MILSITNRSILISAIIVFAAKAGANQLPNEKSHRKSAENKTNIAQNKDHDKSPKAKPSHHSTEYLPENNWYDNHPDIFHPFQRSAFFASAEMGHSQLDSNLKLSYNGSSYGYKASKKDTYMNYKFGYSFDLPLAIGVNVGQNLNSTRKSQRNDEPSTETKTKYFGFSEPELSISGGWSFDDFSLSSSLDYTFATGPKKHESTYPEGSTSEIDSSASGGASSNISLLASYNISQTLLYIGGNYTAQDESKSINVNHDLAGSAPSHTRTETSYQKSASRGYILGVEFKELNHLGISIVKSVDDPLIEKGFEATEDNKKVTVDGVAINAKFNLGSGFAFRPALSYGKIGRDSFNIDDSVNVDKFEISIIGVRLALDYNF